jgi:hypothetical protein
LLLNSEITVKSGIEENIYTEQPEKHVSEYTTTPKSNDIIGDTIRAKGNAYANGERLVGESELKKLLLQIYPIGSIYMSVNNINPSILFGGTWVAWGSGRVPVGVDTNDSNFNSVEKQGGSNTHNHTLQNGYAKMTIWASDNNKIAYDEKSGVTQWTSNFGGYLSSSDNAQKSSTYGMGLGGNTDNGSSLQKYITCYMWKRVA